MDWSDRLLWFVVGLVIGYVIRLLQDIRREVHEVDEIVTKREKNEDGFVRVPFVLDVMLIILFAATMYSVLRVEVSVDRSNHAVAQLEADRVRDQAQNKRIEEVASCTLEFTSKTLSALNGRTTTTSEQLRSDVKVLRSQLKFLEVVLFLPPVSDDIRRQALQDYVQDAQAFVEVTGRQRANVKNYQFPTNIELSKCLGSQVTDAKEQENDERESGTE